MWGGGEAVEMLIHKHTRTQGRETHTNKRVGEKTASVRVKGVVKIGPVDVELAPDTENACARTHARTHTILMCTRRGDSGGIAGW